MKTYSQKPAEIERKWVLIDASSAPLGRVATTAAKYLIGKYKPTYTAHIDAGDYVVVINADKLVATGNKMEAKTYYRHSGYPGGIKERSLKEQVEKDSIKVFEHAVAGMLPKNKLQSERMKRLKVYPGNEQPHDPQKPIKIEVQQ